MPNQEHLAILEQGVEKWDEWRENDPEIIPDLSEADLSRAILNEADLSEAILIEAILIEADLRGADLSRAILIGANLSRADLSRAILNEAELNRADLSRAILSGANLRAADLSIANLRAANLSEAILIEADLRGADLSEAILRRADLSEAILSRADLSEADLSRAILNEADLRTADLRAADLSIANLREANLSEAILIEADLRAADLSMAILSMANLSEAILIEADLRGADLSGAILSEADLSRADLSRAMIDEHTTYYKIIGCKRGVNGIWSEDTDSAALMKLTPPGNSMQGPNPEAVIESLKRARRLHGFSLSLVGVVLLIQFLGLKEVEFLWLKGLKLSPERFAWLALPISIGLLSLVNTFMTSALTGAQYINDRLSATSVGNFPWALSRYAGGIKKRKAVFSWVSFFLIKSQSFITRFIMSFHPLVYIYFFWNQPLGTPSGLFNLGKSPTMVFSPLIFYSLAGLAIIFSAWTFYLSQRFQRPILFDRQTEVIRRDNLTILSDSVKEQTKAVTELVEILKPKPADQPETPAVNEDKDFTEQATGVPDNIKSNHPSKST